MPNREKVIKGLECCRDLDITDMRCPDECPYHDDSNEFGCCHYIPLMNDAITLLNAQKPVSEEVYGRGYDTAGNYHWYGVYTGCHILPREQEPVRPELRMSKHGFRQWLICGACGNKISTITFPANYCPYCGRKVKWNNKENEDGT